MFADLKTHALELGSRGTTGARSLRSTNESGLQKTNPIGREDQTQQSVSHSYRISVGAFRH